jgi:hopene-associated glycosyltransferase HpnB
VPARNEAQTIAEALTSLLQQNYPGELFIHIVDDHSTDGTAIIAAKAAAERPSQSHVKIDSAAVLPPGWTGKLWALNQGLTSSAEEAPDFYWFTDADIVHAPRTLTRLVARAQQENLDLASLMVLLRAKTPPERVLIPAFLFFFLKLYPPAWIANPRSRTAGAAGGCLLLRRTALQRAGGLEAIRSEIIDDCAIAGIVKNSGGRIWMGVTQSSLSLRAYESFAEIRDMIARTAFTQLHHSALLLVGTVAAMFIVYIAPIAILFSSSPVARILGLASWAIMSLTFLPTVHFYKLSPLRAPLLPLAAAFYSYSTILSAIRHWRGCGAQWKGRVQSHPTV